MWTRLRVGRAGQRGRCKGASGGTSSAAAGRSSRPVGPEAAGAGWLAHPGLVGEVHEAAALKVDVELCHLCCHLIADRRHLDGAGRLDGAARHLAAGNRGLTGRRGSAGGGRAGRCRLCGDGCAAHGSCSIYKRRQRQLAAAACSQRTAAAAVRGNYQERVLNGPAPALLQSACKCC